MDSVINPGWKVFFFHLQPDYLPRENMALRITDSPAPRHRGDPTPTSSLQRAYFYRRRPQQVSSGSSLVLATCSAPQRALSCFTSLTYDLQLFYQSLLNFEAFFKVIIVISPLRLRSSDAFPRFYDVLRFWWTLVDDNISIHIFFFFVYELLLSKNNS